MPVCGQMVKAISSAMSLALHWRPALAAGSGGDGADPVKAFGGGGGVVAGVGFRPGHHVHTRFEDDADVSGGIGWYDNAVGRGEGFDRWPDIVSESVVAEYAIVAIPVDDLDR